MLLLTLFWNIWQRVLQNIDNAAWVMGGQEMDIQLLPQRHCATVCWFAMQLQICTNSTKVATRMLVNYNGFEIHILQRILSQTNQGSL